MTFFFFFLFLFVSKSRRAESSESNHGTGLQGGCVSAGGCWLVGCGVRGAELLWEGLGWGQGLPAHSDLWGPESEGKRKHGFAALGSGLPEGGALFFAFL